MASVLKLRRGTRTQNLTFTGQSGEISLDQTANGLRVQDGVTPGGFLLSPNVLSVKDTGAIGDGVANDTSFIQNAHNASNSVRWPKGTYLIGPITIPSNSIVYFDDVIVKRAADGFQILFGDNCIIYGKIELDGLKSIFTGASYGVGLGNNNTCFAKIISHDHYKHGIYSEGSNVTIYSPVSYNNGIFFEEGLGTGDGISFVNGNYNKVYNPVTYGNARTGVTYTTYDPTSGDPDPTLSVGCELYGVRSYSNGYTDVDFEQVTYAKLIGGSVDGLMTYLNSSFVSITNFKAAEIRGVTADYTNISNIILTKSVVSELLYLTGASPTVSGVVTTEASAQSSGTAMVIAPSDNQGNISNIFVKSCFNGIGMGEVTNCSGLYVETAAGWKYAYRNVTFVHWGQVIGSWVRMLAVSATPPTTGTWASGDVFENITPAVFGSGGSQYTVHSSICTVAGTPGTWVGRNTLTGT